jgi:hypothetical protein
MPVPAVLAAAPYVLQGLSALGGIFGKKKRKYMDEETLRQVYGPQAVGRDTTQLAQYILNSPYGQQLMATAAEQGQTIQNEMNAKAAAAGLSPDTGGQSGASDFATSTAAGAQTGLERQTKAGFYTAAMPIAAEMVGGRMQAALGQQSEQNAYAPTNLIGRVGSAAGQVAASLPPLGGKTPVAPPVAADMSRVGAQGTAAQVPQVGMAGQPLVVQPLLQRPSTGQPNEFQMGGGRMRGALTNSRSRSMSRGLVGAR